jgi:hypothetical protein
MMGVIPAWKIWEVIDGDEMKAIRKQTEEVIKKATDQVALDASHGTKAVPDANPSHREDFMALLAAAVRKPQSKD